MQQENKYPILPADDAVQNWFEENIDKECSASSAVYKFRLWLESLQVPQHPVSAGWVKAGITEIDKVRFWTKVTVTDYCWEWSANKCQDGYGMFKLNGKDVKASRVSYTIINGEIPGDLHVLHKCDNPCCVNPDHLFTGTHQDNMLDRQRKGRGKVLGRASKYHGVAFRKDSKNWRAQAFDGKKHLSLGSYDTEEEAALARDKAVIEKGLDLPLNFPTVPNDETGQSNKEAVVGATAENISFEPVIKAAEKVAKIFAHKGDNQNCAICELAKALQQYNQQKEGMK